MGTSKPAVTTLLSGNRNFTIDKLVEIAFVLDSEFLTSIQKVIKKKDAADAVTLPEKNNSASSPSLEYEESNVRIIPFKREVQTEYTESDHNQLAIK